MRKRAWIVAVVGAKGGVGKSTTAISLAVEWHRIGLAVLIVDADPQGTLRTWFDVRTERAEHDERLQVVHLDSAPSGRRASRQSSDEQTAALIRRVVPTLAEGFDVCLLDTPPSNADVQQAAIAIADQAVLPTGPHAADLWGLVPMLELVRLEQRSKRPALIASVLRNKVDRQTVAARDADEALAESELPLLAAQLGAREDFGRATSAGLGVTTYRNWGLAATEVRDLALELEAVSGGGIPAMDQKRRKRA